MKPILSHFTITNCLQETGDDCNLINVFLKFENQVPLLMPLIINYDRLCRFIKTIDEIAYVYLAKIRTNIGGYGPKHSKIFEIINEEGFDLEKYIIAFVNQLDAKIIAEHIEWSENIVHPTNQNAANEVVKDLKEIVNEDFIHYNIKFHSYKEAIDQKIHEVTLSYFPELFDRNRETLETYKSILITTTLAFTSSIDRLLHKND